MKLSLSETRQTINHWRGGIRLYIAIGIVLVTLEGWWWASASYAGSILFATRLEELYAWLALGLLGLSLAIGPVYHTWPRLPAKRLLSEARRMLGIGAAWFATLHVGIAYVSLFKLANPRTLPRTYQQSFALGAVALIILLALAFTSFDKAFNGLGRWWFRLHRLVYLAIILSLLHAFIIGVHAAEWTALIILSTATVFIFGLHFYLAFIRRQRPTIWQLVTIIGMLILLIAVFNFGYGQRLGYRPIGATIMRSSKWWRLVFTEAAAVVLLMTMTVGVAEAHVLKEDNGISAVLHIPPEDNPEAAQPTQLQLLFGDARSTFSLSDCNCQVLVKSGTKTIQQVQLKPAAGATLATVATVQFPTIGVYNVFVQGSARDGKFNNFSLDYLVRVSTSAGTPPPSTAAGSDVVTIGAGSLVILTMVAYTSISRGKRYKIAAKQEHSKSVRRKKS